MDTTVMRLVVIVRIQLIVPLCMELASPDVEKDILDVYAKKVFVKITMLTFENLSISLKKKKRQHNFCSYIFNLKKSQILW